MLGFDLNSDCVRMGTKHPGRDLKAVSMSVNSLEGEH